MRVLDGLAVDLGLEQGAQEVVARVLLALLHLGHEVLDEGDRPFAPDLLVVGEFEHGPHPAGEGVRQLGGHPEDGGDDPDRDLLGVVGGGVGRPLGQEALDQSGAQLPGHGLVALDLSVREPGQQEPAGEGVERRVGRDRRDAVGQDRLLGLLSGEGDDRDVERAEVLDVVGQGHDVLVRGRQPRTPTAVGVGDRTGLAQVVPDAERVIHIGPAEDVEVRPPVGDRTYVGHGSPHESGATKRRSMLHCCTRRMSGSHRRGPTCPVQPVGVGSSLFATTAIPGQRDRDRLRR